MQVTGIIQKSIAGHYYLETVQGNYFIMPVDCQKLSSISVGLQARGNAHQSKTLAFDGYICPNTLVIEQSKQLD